MSIILKGIDLPKADEIHRLIVLPTGQVMEDKRPYFNEYEAVQIPKGHGDIKDVGKLEDELDERCGQLSAEIVRNAPTILEAEDPKPSDIRPITGKLKYTLDVENGILTRGIEPEDE